jgi:hypothetical protein
MVGGKAFEGMDPICRKASNATATHLV